MRTTSKLSWTEFKGRVKEIGFINTLNEATDKVLNETEKKEMDEILVLSKSQFALIQKILCLMYTDDETIQADIEGATNIEIERGS